MKFRIESKPSPLRQLDNFRQLKVALKAIKADEGGRFLDALLTHCAILKSAIGKDFSSADQEHVAIRCDVYFNIPLVSSAGVGGETASGLQKYGKNGIQAMLENKKELGEYLQGLDRIPSIILPNKLELTQRIGAAKSKFVYELIG